MNLFTKQIHRLTANLQLLGGGGSKGQLGGLGLTCAHCCILNR